MAYIDGSYWKKRSDMLYYQYFHYIIRCIGVDARSIIDVGSGNSPYLDWFDWIETRVSVDINVPYSSPAVRGVRGDIHELVFPERFDLCTCMQVLEHVAEPAPFARRLLKLGKRVLVSVPYKWPRGTPGHVNDPVRLKDVIAWFGRDSNYHLVVTEPFTPRVGERLFALFDVEDPGRVYGREIRDRRRPR
jgi:SAM-dependent methyltransferase